jgi:hypothetical protein
MAAGAPSVMLSVGATPLLVLCGNPPRIEVAEGVDVSLAAQAVVDLVNKLLQTDVPPKRKRPSSQPKWRPSQVDVRVQTLRRFGMTEAEALAATEHMRRPEAGEKLPQLNATEPAPLPAPPPPPPPPIAPPAKPPRRLPVEHRAPPAAASAPAASPAPPRRQHRSLEPVDLAELRAKLSRDVQECLAAGLRGRAIGEELNQPMHVIQPILDTIRAAGNSQ